MQYAVHRGDAEAQRINAITEKVIGCAIEVHKALGPGLLESTYEECTCYEIRCGGLKAERQVPLPIVYKRGDAGLWLPGGPGC